MKRLLLAIASAAVLLCPDFGHAQGYWPGSPGVSAKHSQHATDCTALTSGIKGEICEELDDDTFYVCEIASCTAPGDWTSYTGAGGAGDVSAVGNCATGACFEGVGAESTLSFTAGILLDLDDDNNGTESLIVRDGLNATVFTVTEGSAVAITGVGSNFNVSGTAPYIGITDTDGTNDPADTGVFRLGNTDTICWEISPAGTDACVSVSSASVLTPTGIAAIKVPSSLAPIVAAAGQIAFDTNILGTKGAAVVHNGTEATYVIASTDAPANGEVPMFVDATDTVEWQSAGAGTVTDVGDCNGPVCFTGAEGTTLSSNTDLILELDKDTGGSNSFIIKADGGASTVYNANEGGAFTINSADPYLGLADSDSAQPNDPADTGVIRVGNSDSICWEASVSGTDACITYNTSESFNLTGSVSQLQAPMVRLSTAATPSLFFADSGDPRAAEIDTDPSSGGNEVFSWKSSTTTLYTISATGATAILAGTSALSWDLGDTNSFEVPNAAAPTTDAIGEIALDTTITDHQPLHQYFDGGENMSIIAIDTAQLPALDNEIIKYDAATDKFVLESDAGGATCVHLAGSQADCAQGGGGCSGGLIEGTNITFATAEFQPAADQKATWNFPVPAAIAVASTISVNVKWMDDDAGCDNSGVGTDVVCFQFATVALGDGDNWSTPTFATAAGMNDTCVDDLQMQSVTATAYSHGMTTTGEMGVFTLTRDVAGTPTGCGTEDQYGGFAKVVSVELCAE